MCTLHFFVVLIFFYMVAPASSATLTVNWSLGTDYTPLSTGKTFAVDDTIGDSSYPFTLWRLNLNNMFNYGAGHTVDEVSENDYKSCTLANSIASDSSGTTTIALKTTGLRYFICGIPGHCVAGMKLAITVVTSSSNNVGGGTTTTPTPFTGGGGTTTTTPTPLITGAGGYIPTTTQAIPCAVSSPLRPLVATWALVFMFRLFLS